VNGKKTMVPQASETAKSDIGLATGHKTDKALALA